MRKIKRAISVLSLVVLFMFAMGGCGSNGSGYRHTLELIDENLSFDFEFLQNMDSVSTVGYHAIEDGITTSYIPEKYWLSYQTGGDYVKYSVSPYPNYTSEKKYITMIYCSDASKTFFGCTLNSSSAVIKKAFEDAGFATEVTSGKNASTKITADLGNGIVMGVYIGMDKKYFSIAAKISDNSNIVIDWR